MAISVVNCTITMITMIFMLPKGIIDGIFAIAALILIIVQYFGDKRAQDWLRVD